MVKKEDRVPEKKPESLFGGRISNLIESIFSDSFFPKELFRSDWDPKIDVVDKGNVISVKADLPGIDEKDLNVSLEDHVLTIEGKREEEHEEKKDGYRRLERSFGSFSRSIALPAGIAADKVEAVYKKGVLNIEIPKNPDKAPKKLEVKVS
ncbi:MAG: hypothetical protein A2Y33_14225 [Spirochaetes bacterium GWF1_51_8]|nr:MAG: hypothetical protein A2Y33_14225 [Spirochaetes bacterium GWF1_51_8]